MREYTNSKISEIIDEHIHNLRDRNLLKRRYIDGILLDDLGREFELSIRQVQNIIYKSKGKIFKHI